MDRINVAIALDRRVLRPAYVMIRSLVKNNDSHCIYLYVLHSELEDKDCRFLQDALLRGSQGKHQVEFIQIDASTCSDLPYTLNWSLEMYYRLMLPELLGEEIDRILYLDIDIIVNKDILEFYNTDFEGNLLVVTKDAGFAREVQDSQEVYAFWKRLIEDGMIYFCSGILLMNLAELKREYSFQRYIEIFNNISDKVKFMDQDLLNYVHYKQVKLVDEKKFGLFAWTAHEMGMSYEEVCSDVSILHFAGSAKPWITNVFRYDIEKIWWEYAKDSPFYQELLETLFYQSMESGLAENKLKAVTTENNELKQLLNKCQAIIQKLSAGV